MMVLNNGHNVICSVGMMLVIGLPRDMKCVKEAKEHLTLSREALLYSIDTKNKYMYFVTQVAGLTTLQFMLSVYSTKE